MPDKERVVLYCDRMLLACLCFLVFFLPFAKAGVEICVWMAVFFWMVKRMAGYRTGTKPGLLPATELNKAIGIFVAVNALTILVSVDAGLSVRAFFGKIMKFVLIYFITVETVNSKKRLKNILMVIVLSSVLIIADAGAQYFLGKDFLRGFVFSRLSASFGSANGFAGWLVMMVFILLGALGWGYRRGSTRRGRSLFLALLVLLLSTCFVVTSSRGAWLGLFIGGGLCGYYFLVRLFPDRRRIFGYSLAFMYLLVLFFGVPKVAGERMESIQIRRVLWRESLNIIEDFPVLGTGLNTYSVVARHYKISEGGGIYPHNSFLQMTAETGILGLIPFLWILASFFRLEARTFRKKKDLLSLGLWGGILAFLVQSFFDTNLYALQLVILFWFMMGLSVAVPRLGINADQ